MRMCTCRQNDGTLMTMEHARRYPILTIACGPTNSIRGASYLIHLRRTPSSSTWAAPPPTWA